LLSKNAGPVGVPSSPSLNLQFLRAWTRWLASTPTMRVVAPACAPQSDGLNVFSPADGSGVEDQLVALQ